MKTKTLSPVISTFRDNERDYKIGLTNNLVVRGRAYKTENPRDTVVDFFFVETYAEAEAIESEMKRAAKAEGLCSFPNSREWLKRTASAKDFWDRFAKKYAKRTVAEWEAYSPSQASKLRRELKNMKKSLRSKSDLTRKLKSKLNEKPKVVVKTETVDRYPLWPYCLVGMGLICFVLGDSVVNYASERIKAINAREANTDLTESEADKRLALADRHIVKVDGKLYWIKEGSVFSINKKHYMAKNSTSNQILENFVNDIHTKINSSNGDFKSHPIVGRLMNKPELKFDLFWRCLDAQVISKLSTTISWNSSA